MEAEVRLAEAGQLDPRRPEGWVVAWWGGAGGHGTTGG